MIPHLRWPLSWLSLLLALLLVWPHPALTAERVAVALDVSGPVTLVSALNGFEDESPLQRTNYLSVGNRVVIAAGGEVTLMHLEQFKRFTVRGPNEVSIQAEGVTLKTGQVEPLAGSGHAHLSLLASLGKERKTLKMPSAAIGIRDLDKKAGGIVLISPLDKERLSGEPPLFAWHPVPDQANYRLLLKKADGSVLLETPATANPFPLPDTLPLQAGEQYFWQVVAGSEESAVQSLPWSFTLLTAEEQRDLQQWRPPMDAPISDHVLYALLLERMGVIREAKAQWQRLHERDPADPLFAKKAR
ncbi:MAG: hypothetical protein H7836_14865 [Magnetococcus sp. YQC-3]